MFFWFFLVLIIAIISFEYERFYCSKMEEKKFTIKDWYSTPVFLFSFHNILIRVISPNKPFVSLSLFPEHKILEENFHIIKEELDQLTNRNLSLKEFGEIEPLAKDLSSKKWKSFFVKCYAKPTPLSKAHMPKTTKIIESCKNIKLAMFSILEPGAKIKAHAGPYKLCYRYHLTFECSPCNSAFINVGGINHHWKVGESILFDDTFVHYVENPTNKRRIVLFCDIDRKLPMPINWFIQLSIWLAAKSKHAKNANLAANSFAEPADKAS